MDTPKRRTWRENVAACFGAMDQKFASHPLDEKRAKAMIKEAHESGASPEEILEAIRDHLESKKVSQEHLDKELARAKKMVG